MIELLLIATIPLLPVILTHYVTLKVLKPPRRIESWSPGAIGLKYEDITFRAYDRATLKGWWIQGKNSSTIIILHGYSSSRWGLKKVIALIGKAGYNILVFDFRGHGESKGTCTLGLLEVLDLVSAINWLKENKPNSARKIGVIGYSMGGAVAIMALARECRISAAISDSPYINLEHTAKRWLKEYAKLLLPFYPLMKFFLISARGIDVKKLNLTNYADKIYKPLLIIAGTQDNLVEIDEIKGFVEELGKYNNSVELWITEAPHVGSIQKYPEEYEEKIVSFLGRYL